MKAFGNFKAIMKKIYIIVIITLLISISVGLVLYARAIKVRSDVVRPEKVDLIVVLTGGSGRIIEGARLLEEGIAPRLFVTGVEAAGQFYLNAPGYDLKKLKDEGKVLVDPTAKNTIENALQTKAMITQLKKVPSSILIVSSTYHLPRAELMFKKVLPKTIKIFIYPVKSSNYDPDVWWRDFTSLKLLVGEFFKYLWYRLFL